MQVVNSVRLIALLLGCLLVGQSVLPLAVFAADEPRDFSGVYEAADILGVRANVDRVLALQAAGAAPSEELLLNKAIVLRQLLLGYLEVRQTSDMLDEAIDDTYDAIDKQVRAVNRRVEMVNIANFTSFGVLFNIAAADRLRKLFISSNTLTFISASLTAGLGGLAAGLSYTGTSIDRCRPNPLADVFGLEQASVHLPELVRQYIDSTPSGSTKSRQATMLDLWRTEFGVKDSILSRQILSAECPKRHFASTGLLNQRLALLFSLNALAEQFDSELLALLRAIETTTVPATNGLPLAADCRMGPAGIEAAKLLQVEQCAADIISMNKAGARNGSDVPTLALDLYVLEKVLGAALEVRQVVDRIDREKHYQFDVLMPQLVRVRNRVDMLTNTATFLEIGTLKNIGGGQYHRNKNRAGDKIILTMDAIAVLLSTVNLACQSLYRHKQESKVNVLANVLHFDIPSQSRYSPLISSYMEDAPPGSAGVSRKQQLLNHWKQIGLLSNKQRSAEELASMPATQDKRVETIALVSKRVRMLFDLRSAIETMDSGLLQLLTAVILPTPESAAENKIDKQLALIKRVMHDGLEVRSAADQVDNQLSHEYTAKEAILTSRNRGLQYNNILNFTQSGTIGVVAQSLSINKLSTQANTLDLISGSTLLLLSSAALLQQHMGSRPAKPEMNVLAQILVPGTVATDTTKECAPPSVLQYLNAPAGASNLTRREMLIDRWKKSGVITTNLRNQRNLVKLSASGQTSKKESLQLIADRIVMLHDVQTTIESMDRHLVKTLREGGPPQN